MRSPKRTLDWTKPNTGTRYRMADARAAPSFETNLKNQMTAIPVGNMPRAMRFSQELTEAVASDDPRGSVNPARSRNGTTPSPVLTASTGTDDAPHFFPSTV